MPQPVRQHPVAHIGRFARWLPGTDRGRRVAGRTSRQRQCRQHGTAAGELDEATPLRRRVASLRVVHVNLLKNGEGADEGEATVTNVARRGRPVHAQASMSAMRKRMASGLQQRAFDAMQRCMARI